jgi:hypothetical protein
MKRQDFIATRQALLSRVPLTGKIVRGSVIERIVWHRQGCATCARGEGHPLSVLTVSYPGGPTRKFSLRRDQVAEVRRWLANYQQLKDAIEAIRELNHDLLRAGDAASKLAGPKR